MMKMPIVNVVGARPNFMKMAPLMAEYARYPRDFAPVPGIPCLTLRENTDRPVTVTEGTSAVVGTLQEKITAEAAKVIEGNRKKGHVPKYWDGKASARIIRCLLEHPAGK